MTDYRASLSCSLWSGSRLWTKYRTERLHPATELPHSSLFTLKTVNWDRLLWFIAIPAKTTHRLSMAIAWSAVGNIHSIFIMQKAFNFVEKLPQMPTFECNKICKLEAWHKEELCFYFSKITFFFRRSMSRNSKHKWGKAGLKNKKWKGKSLPKWEL